MTDERIKEEFEKGKSDPLNTVTVRYQALIANYDAVDKAAAIGYYMKCKAAERLAKIEVLEEQIRRCNETGIADRLVTAKMIEELKEEQ